MISIALLDQIVVYTSILLCFSGAALLFDKSNRDSAASRALRILAFILLIWGVAFLVVKLPAFGLSGMEFHPLAVSTLIFGNLYLIITLLYPHELAKPGWLSLRRITLLLLPYLFVTGLYFVILGVLDEPIRHLHSMVSMLIYFSEFNVWYRVVFYLSVCCYMVYMFAATGIMSYNPRPLPGDQTPTLSRSTINHLRIYGIGTLCISLAYLLVLMVNSPLSRLIHHTTCMVFFSILLWKVLRQNPAANPHSKQ